MTPSSYLKMKECLKTFQDNHQVFDVEFVWVEAWKTAMSFYEKDMEYTLKHQIAEAEERHYQARKILERIEFAYREAVHDEIVAANRLLDLTLKSRNQHDEP